MASTHPPRDPTPPAPRGRLRLNEPLARHSTWRVGGPADRYYEPADDDDLAVFLAGLPEDEPLLWLGFGSNLLVRDGGWRGTVLAPGGAGRECRVLGPGRLRVGAAVACARVARFSAEAGCRGAEFLAGIPGTLGGALAMNAGAHGAETWSLVSEVSTIDRRGRRHRRGPAVYRIGYRSVQGPAPEWFLGATLQLQSDPERGAAARIEAMLARRAATQPIGRPSCGSVFRNPPGDFAARLIEACGLKGHCLGGACVSAKHANFILNQGGARAADIEALIAHVRAAVQARFGVSLQPEVRTVGEAAAPGEQDP